MELSICRLKCCHYVPFRNKLTELRLPDGKISVALMQTRYLNAIAVPESMPAVLKSNFQKP